MIVDPAQLWLFIPAALALNLTPGADMMFCAGQGARYGKGAGVAAALGISAGGLVHVGLAAAGLAAFLAAHPAMFEAVRWGGVGYLLWLAIGALRGPRAASAQPIHGGHAFRDAVLVSVLNPKVAVFILALLPQFVDPARGAPGMQFLVLGLVFTGGGFMVNGAVGMFAGSLRRRMGATARLRGAAGALRWGVALLFAGLAARLAFDRGA